MPTPSAQTSSLQGGDTINGFHLNYLVGGRIEWQGGAPASLAGQSLAGDLPNMQQVGASRSAEGKCSHTGRQTQPPTGISQLPDPHPGCLRPARAPKCGGRAWSGWEKGMRTRGRVSPWLSSPSCPSRLWFPQQFSFPRGWTTGGH